MERVKEEAAWLRSHDDGIEMNREAACRCRVSADLLEALAAQRDAFCEAAHTAILKIQDGAASHAEGMLIQVLAEDCPKHLDNGTVPVKQHDSTGDTK